MKGKLLRQFKIELFFFDFKLHKKGEIKMQLTIELQEGKIIDLHERHVSIQEMDNITNWFENEVTPIVKFINNSTSTTHYLARQAIIRIIKKI